LFKKDYLVVLSTCPEAAVAHHLARTLLEAELAACVNILPGVRSMYLWKGSLQSDDEVLMVIKTTAANFERLRETLVTAHPYELPEVVALEIADGHHPYLEWLAEPNK
jgi:periplasmic divalent cation tolerance protein